MLKVTETIVSEFGGGPNSMYYRHIKTVDAGGEVSYYYVTSKGHTKITEKTWHKRRNKELRS